MKPLLKKIKITCGAFQTHISPLKAFTFSLCRLNLHFLVNLSQQCRLKGIFEGVVENVTLKVKFFSLPKNRIHKFSCYGNVLTKSIMLKINVYFNNYIK